ncbi:MAG: membrane protein insertase YidC, partial [Planctomycetes bacterium]|nr:membrane protein insertase YidC [Planctomycetota bacterium]
RDAEWRSLARGIQPRDTYELACWVKLDAAQGSPLPSVRLLQQGSDGQEIAWKDDKGADYPAALDLSVPRAEGWQRLAARFLAEPLTRQVRVLLHAPQGFKGQVWLDDVSLVRFGEPSLVLLPPRRAASEAIKADEERLFEPRRFRLAAQTDSSVSFRATIPEANLEITKTFTLPKGDDPLQRHVTLEVQFKNLGEKEFKHPGYLLRGPSGLPADPLPPSWKHGETLPNTAERQGEAAHLSAAVAREAAGGQINVPVKACSDVQSLETPAEGKPGTTWDEVGVVLWTAVTSNYFASILEPRQGDSPRMKVESGGARCLGADKANLAGVVQVAPFTLGPSGKGDDAAVHRYRLYAGPKKPDLLASYGANYEQLIPSRWLDPLTAACTWVLHASYFLIPNYGIAIIVLTAIVRLVLHPLSKKSQTSMQKMQKLSPQVAEIREKFKGDKKRQQEEMMKLYKTYGVNPMGGCLPIVLQIPVFIGLWRALQESLELRQAPFALWIQDLSQPDSLFGAVNVLPIASCAMMFIQQKLTPKAGDPQQQQTQKIMGYVMPVFLGLILYGLPSGLGLYFIASTLVGLAEQRVIKRHMDRLGELKPVVQKPSKQSKKAIFSKGAKKPKRRLF